MITKVTIATCALVMSAATTAFAAGGSMGIIARFAIGGNETSYDYLTAAGDGRLFVAHGDRVEVLSLPDGKKVGEIDGMNGVHGIELVPGVGKGYTTDGQDRKVTVFDLHTLAVLRRLGPTGAKPDAVHYDQKSGYLYVVNGGDSGNLTIIDPNTDAITATLEIGGGKLEQIGFDGRGLAFVNDEGKSVIHVIDTTNLKKTGEWSLRPCEEPTGMAVDSQNHRIFSACGNGKMAVLDSDTGRLIAMLPISGDPDGVAFDTHKSIAYVSNREGLLDVFHELTPDHVVRQKVVKTGPGARTLALDATTGVVYLPTGKFTKDAASGRPGLVPGSFAILAVGPLSADKRK